MLGRSWLTDVVGPPPSLERGTATVRPNREKPFPIREWKSPTELEYDIALIDVLRRTARPISARLLASVLAGGVLDHPKAFVVARLRAIEDRGRGCLLIGMSPNRTWGAYQESPGRWMSRPGRGLDMGRSASDEIAAEYPRERLPADLNELETCEIYRAVLVHLRFSPLPMTALQVHLAVPSNTFAPTVEATTRILKVLKKRKLVKSHFLKISCDTKYEAVSGTVRYVASDVEFVAGCAPEVRTVTMLDLSVAARVHTVQREDSVAESHGSHEHLARIVKATMPRLKAILREDDAWHVFQNCRGLAAYLLKNETKTLTTEEIRHAAEHGLEHDLYTPLRLTQYLAAFVRVGALEAVGAMPARWRIPTLAPASS